MEAMSNDDPLQNKKKLTKCDATQLENKAF